MSVTGCPHAVNVAERFLLLSRRQQPLEQRAVVGEAGHVG
jgi:hypothetical protein